MKIVFQKSTLEAMQKAFGKRDLSKLRKEVVTDKNGHKKTVYKKVDEQKNSSAATAKQDGSYKTKASTPKYSGNVGDIVSFTVNDSAGERTLTDGKITAIGNDGVIIRRQGVEYRVLNKDIGRKQRKNDGTIPAQAFDANSYKAMYTDSRAANTTEGIQFVYDSLGTNGSETRAFVEKKLNEQVHRMKKGDTRTRYTVNGEYTSERKALHEKIIRKILTPEKVASCIPEKGQKPKFVMLGGRGGSGKSWFTDKKRAAAEGRNVMFDSDKYIVLDADSIKEELPEYEGWNAAEVHEESSELMKVIKTKAMELGLNIIVDGTMNYNPKKPDKVKNEMLSAREKGYGLEAHYMFLPVQESAKRAMSRFRTDAGDYSGRLVPTDILLQMQDNEKSFDSVKDIVDDWSFHDNQESRPKLISKKGLE